jgi:pyruvate/2-oxoglutarate dehydrogenase complex dihydrolipoamide acyltransferase (E2) component
VRSCGDDVYAQYASISKQLHAVSSAWSSSPAAACTAFLTAATAREAAAAAAAAAGTDRAAAAGGAAGVSWRMRALQRAQQLAKEQGRGLNEVRCCWHSVLMFKADSRAQLSSNACTAKLLGGAVLLVCYAAFLVAVSGCAVTTAVPHSWCCRYGS